MTEKVLPYDRAVVPQETGFWCGPASTQIVLNTRGIHFTEADLAQQCRTHEGGTDWIGQITEVLNRHVHDADYITVSLPNDPPTAAEVDEFWRNLRTSIDTGFGVVGNFVSPANNPPRGVRGSESPNGYGRSTIYHYITFMGYAEDGGERFVWVADPGFAPFGYWLTLEQAVLLMAPKGYSYARAHGVPGVPDPIGPDDAQLLAYAMGESLGLDRYRELLPAVREALAASDCTNPRRVAMWLAQIGHESAGLKYMQELADGSAYEGRADLGNTQPGDGMRFKGHGPIQITGRHNHAAVSRWAFDRNLVPSADYFVEFPEELAGDRYGMLGAVWYWTDARPQINGLCDAEDLDGVTRAINGGLHGIDDRRQRYYRALEVASAFLSVGPPTPVAPEPVGPPPRQDTPLTGRPRHHAEADDVDGTLLSLRAEGLLTQAMVFAIADAVGVNARELYDNVRAGF